MCTYPFKMISSNHQLLADISLSCSDASTQYVIFDWLLISVTF